MAVSTAPFTIGGGLSKDEVKRDCVFWLCATQLPSGTARKVGFAVAESEALEEPRPWWVELRRGGIALGAWGPSGRPILENLVPLRESGCGEDLLRLVLEDVGIWCA